MAHSIETTIMTALSTLPAAHLYRLTLSISAAHHRRILRLISILSSPSLFTLSLRRLQSLSLHNKCLLVARHLLSDLTLLRSHLPSFEATPLLPTRLRDLDAVLLLLLLCELHHHDRDFLDAPLLHWRMMLSNYLSDSIMGLSSFGGCSNGEILTRFVETAKRCWNFVGATMSLGGGGDKEGGVAAASVAAVVALPSVEVGVCGGGECVICKEEMGAGREVCELPCGHLFHWACILRWLGRRDTCPCCRRRLPTDDVRREIERMLEDLSRLISSQ